MIQKRNNQSEPEKVSEVLESMTEKGWDIRLDWDKDLKVWRAHGVWRSQKREGRGSTQLLALDALDQLTPSGN